MFKKRILTLGIMIFAFISVIGVGFSSWYFGAQEKRTDANSNVLVTHANTFGEFGTIAGTYTLTLDQPSTTDSNITLSGKNGSNDLTKIEATWTVPYATYEDMKDALKYSILVFIKTDTLGQYVTVGAENGFASATAADLATAGDHNHTGYTAFVLTPTKTENAVAGATTGLYVSAPTEGTNVTATFVLSLEDVPFDWVADKVPTDFASYQTMIQELGCVADGTSVVPGQTYNTDADSKDVIIEFVAVNDTTTA